MHHRHFSRSLAVLTLVAMAATAGAFADRSKRSGSGFKGPPVASRTAPDSEVQLFRIIASDGDITPSLLKVKRFKQVRLVFISKDGNYGIRFKEFGIKRKLTPEKPVIVDLMPTEPGPFEFRCTRKWGVKRFSKNGILMVY